MRASVILSPAALALAVAVSAAPPEGKGGGKGGGGGGEDPPTETSLLEIAAISNGRRSDAFSLLTLDKSNSQDVSDSGGSRAYVLHDIAPRGVDIALLLDGASIRVVSWTLDGEIVKSVETDTLNPGAPPNCMAIADSGDWLIYSVYGENSLRNATLVGANLTGTGVEFTLPVGSQIVSCEIGPSSEIYYVLVDEGGTYSIVEYGSTSVLYSSFDYLHHLDTSADGSKLMFVEEGVESRIKHINLGSGSVTTTNFVGTSPHFACSSNSVIYSGRSRNKNAVLIDGNVFDDSGKITHTHWYC